VVHVVRAGDDALVRRCLAQLARNACPPRGVTIRSAIACSSDVATAIAEVAASEGADVVVIASRGSEPRCRSSSCARCRMRAA
jgi:hypothetical protein